ncbi:unnamed protein product [Blepharisma stoltei]|uniref:C3H1-type domain-containing protein n=1 Tax=Blepharisma stoltei TaxID=1481888 RepID=A0AAU9K5C8_9CILI|nr:unnamed protein product [Blepharisma stoltei]
MLPQITNGTSPKSLDQFSGLSLLEIPEETSKGKSKKRSKKANDFSIRFKTEICRNWENGFCEFGEKCTFAHGQDELRSKEGLPIKQSKACKQYFELGYCLLGSKCASEHADDSDKTASSSPSNSTVASRKSSVDSSCQCMPLFIDLECRGMYI